MPDLLAFLRERAPDHADIPVLQPADPFLETAGEDLRRRIFVTEDGAGETLCLRPEFTIPLCLQHIEFGNGAARYAYQGLVFRQGRSGASEFVQAGLEDIGASNRIAADASAIADMLAALEKVGAEEAIITLGDQAVFADVVAALALPDAIAARLLRRFGEPEAVASLIDTLASPPPAAGGDDRFEALALSGDRAGLEAAIEEELKAAGLFENGARPAADIAGRMIARMAEKRFRLTPEKADILRAFLSIHCPLEKAEEALAAFARKNAMVPTEALETFSRRNAALADAGIDLSSLEYRASFGRKLDYYTGIVFEARLGESAEPLAGGGRYDALCSMLGSQNPLPAVGFSITLDRLPQEGARP